MKYEYILTYNFEPYQYSCQSLELKDTLQELKNYRMVHFLTKL